VTCLGVDPGHSRTTVLIYYGYNPISGRVPCTLKGKKHSEKTTKKHIWLNLIKQKITGWVVSYLTYNLSKRKRSTSTIAWPIGYSLFYSDVASPLSFHAITTTTAAWSTDITCQSSIHTDW